MARTREWLKLGSLVGVTGVLAVVFLSVVDRPSDSLAQETVLPALQAPQPAPASQDVQRAADLGDAFASVAETVRPAVVYITNTAFAGTQTPQNHPDLPPPFDQFFRSPQQQNPGPRVGSGSGFLISPDGYILTNNHVVEGADELQVRLFDGREFRAGLVGRDPQTDVAVIKIDGENLPTVGFGDSDGLRVGEWVLAVGNPLGEAFSFTITAGIVSGRGRPLSGLQRSQWDIQDFIQTDAVINRGNSGGPLVNIHGQVVGINSAIASETGFYEGYGFAIPANLARNVADQLVREGRVTRAALGIQVRDATAVDAEYVGLDGVYGVSVDGFSNEDSPAQRAGLRIEDVIVEVDGRRVEYVAQLQQLVGFKRPGQEVRVTVARPGGERRTYNVRLIEAQTTAAPEVAAADRNRPEETASFEERLGLDLSALSSSMASRAGVPEGERGLVITGVDRNGPARSSGFITPEVRPGYFDMVTHVNGERTGTLNELQAALRTVNRGDVVSLRVVRVAGEDAAPQTRVVRYRAGGER